MKTRVLITILLVIPLLTSLLSSYAVAQAPAPATTVRAATPMAGQPAVQRPEKEEGMGPKEPLGEPASVSLPDLSGSYKAAPLKVEMGDLIAYTLAISNSGTLSVTKGILTDTIPDGTTCVGDSVHCSSGSCSCAAGALSWTGVVTAGEMVTVEFSVDTTGAECGEVITNTAIITDPALPAEVELQARTELVDTIYYIWDFEADNGGFVPSGEWEWGMPLFGPPRAHSGQKVWGTDLDGNYDDGSTSVLTETVDLTGIDPVGGLWLQWWEWYDLEDWKDDADIYVNGVNIHHATGSSNGWKHYAANITGYTGQVITLEFTLQSDWGGNYAGYYIDDVAIHVGCPPPDIKVDAPPLEVGLLPDATGTLTFTICNTGSGALAWGMREVTPTVPLAGSMPGGSPVTAPLGPRATVDLALDDGSAEQSLGCNDHVEANQFLWFNRFTPSPGDFPFQLEQISVVFGSVGVPSGGHVDLVVYEDTDGDGDPSNAAWLATYSETIQANDGVAWSTYDLPAPLTLYGPGDVLIGAINRYQDAGDTDLDYPSRIDQDGSQGRSWVTSWTGNAPDPPLLPGDEGFGLIDNFLFPGNWLVRGSGRGRAEDIPWLSEEPIRGTVEAEMCVTVKVSFDAAGMVPGHYYADLLIQDNDPDTPRVVLPVTLTILSRAYLPVVLKTG